MSIEWVSGAGAACAFLLAATYEMLTRRGVVLTLAGPILSWLPALIHDFSVDSATERTRIERHGSLRGERHAGGS
jgi:hypothetical protein